MSVHALAGRMAHGVGELQPAHDREHDAAGRQDRVDPLGSSAGLCRRSRRRSVASVRNRSSRSSRSRVRRATAGSGGAPRSTTARCHASSPVSSSGAALADVGSLAQQVVDVVGDRADGVGERLRRRRIGVVELGEQFAHRRRQRGPTCAVADGDRLGDVDGQRRRQLRGDPPPDRIVTAGEVPGVVGVQALDALPRAADAAGRPVFGVGGNVGVALGGVAGMGRRPVRRRRQPPRRHRRRRRPPAG